MKRATDGAVVVEVVEGVEDDEAAVVVADEDALDCEATIPSALMYSYIESRAAPPQISVLSPSQVIEHPTLPSGATPPPLEKAFPQWHSLWYSIPA